MKRLIIVLMTLVLMMSLAACGNSDGKKKLEEIKKKEKEQIEEQVEAEKEKIEEQSNELKPEVEDYVEPKPEQTPTQTPTQTQTPTNEVTPIPATPNNRFVNNSLEGRWVVNAISVVPREVYYQDGKLVAHCYVVNGYSTTATKVHIERLVVTNGNNVQIANGAFGNQNLTIAPLSYVEHTFTFSGEALTTANADLSTLGFDAEFYAVH